MATQRLLSILAEKKKLTTEEKLEVTTRALEVYANIDLWFCTSKGSPIWQNKPYGDGIKFNAFGLTPAQEGWELAKKTLERIHLNVN